MSVFENNIGYTFAQVDDCAFLRCFKWNFTYGWIQRGEQRGPDPLPLEKSQVAIGCLKR